MNQSKQYNATLPLSVDDSLNTDKLHMELNSGPYLEYPDGTVPMVTKMNTGRMSPVRSRTMKEYDTQITDLKKENFNLKLRIYFMEERMQQRLGDGDDVFKFNIELKVEVETLKKELKEKQELLQKASEAIEAFSAKREEDMQEVHEEMEKEMCDIRQKLEEEVESKKKEVEASQKSLQEATHQLTDLEYRNEQLLMEIRHLDQSKEIQMQSLKEDLVAQNRELTAQIAENQKNLAEMDHILKIKEDLEVKVESMEKELSRKDRDMEHLSCIVKDTTQLESQSFLAPSHLQDEVDDQRSELETLKTKVEELKLDANKKNEMIGKLEDLLKTNEEEKKDALRKLEDADNKLKKQTELQPVWDSTVKGLHQDLRKRNKEVDDLKDKLERKEEELRQCHDTLHAVSIQKQKNLLRTLGKKEGELEGFKELLNKAETALRQSEDAVQDLQCQLRKEKETASEDYRSQHLQFKIDDLEIQLQTKEKIILQLSESLKDKERQMQQCMEIFRPTPQEDTSIKDKWIRELQSRLQEKEKAVEESLNEKIRLADDKDAEIRQLRREIRDKEHEMERANQMLLTAEQTIECIEKEGNEKDKTLKQLTNSLKACQKALEDAVTEHKQVIKRKEDEIERLKKGMKTPDAELKDTDNAETMNSLLKKLRDKDEDLLTQAEKHDDEMNKLDKEIHNLKSELAEVQRELQSVENRCGWSEKRNEDAQEELRQALKEKEKMIEALVASGQEKERLIAELRGIQSGLDAPSLQNQLEKLKNELQDKNDLLDSLRFHENEQVLNGRIGNLKLELEAAKDDLRQAFRREEMLKQELYDLKSKLVSSPGRIGETHKVEIEVRNVSDRYSNPSPGKSGKVSMEENHKLKDTLEQQLSELETLRNAIQRERQIILTLNENEPKLNGAINADLEAELKNIQDLRKELEAVLEKNNKMTLNLEQQYILYGGRFTNDFTTGMMSELNSDLDALKKELEQKKIENNTLLAQLYDMKYIHRDHDLLREAVQTSPRSENRWSMSSTSSSSTPEFDVPLNRQTLSDMSAPMLRRYIRQIQKQLDTTMHEKDELQGRLNLSQRVNAREIPGKNEDDFNSIPHLRMEIVSLQSKLATTENDLKLLREKFGLDENTPCRYSELPEVSDIQRENVKLKNDYRNALDKVSSLQEQIDNSMKIQREKLDKVSQTMAWGGLIPTLGPKSLDMKVSSKKNSSQIPRPHKAGQPMNGDHSHLQKPEILREMLSESRNRIGDLESKLEATEGTVRIQTQKMKHYKALLEDHGLLAKSPCVSRSHSETNLAAFMATDSKIPVMKRAMSNEHLHCHGKPVEGQKRHGSDSSEGSQEDSLLPTQTLVDLQGRIATLHQSLQETKNNNFELQQKLWAKQNSEQIIVDLKNQLGQSRETIDALEKQLKSYQGSSMQEVLELQRDEIASLRKRMCDSQNSCVQLNQWLGDLSMCLDGLNEDEMCGSIKQKVQQTRMVAKSLSHLLDADSDDSGNEGNQHLQGRHSPTKSPKREGRRLAEELEAKDAEIKSLREELEEKKSFIGRLNTNLLIAQRQLLSWQDCGKGSSTSGTSAADGNVFDSSHHGARDIFHRDSLSPASQTSNRLAGDHDTSVEKVRHNSEMTQSSRRSSEDIEVQDTTVTSSRTDGSLQHRKGPTRNVSEKMDFENRSIASFGLCGFNSDERLYGNARFADRDMFDHSLVVNGHDEASFLENRDFFEDVNKFSDVDDSCVTQRSSFMNRSVAVQSTEVQQLKSRLNVMEDLNMTLKDELQAYENLCSSIGIQSSPRKSPRKSSDDNDLLREHLSEIRSLRIKLEKSLKDSEKLSQKLQQDMEESHSSSSTTSVYMYSQHQAHINELQRAIDKLKAQLREKENNITEKITIIREKEKIIHESKTIITDKEEKMSEILREKDEQTRSSQQTLVVQQRRIEKQDETIRQLKEKLELQVESLHQQESKLKEQYEVIQKQELQLAEAVDDLSHKETTLSKQYELLQQQDLQIDKQKELIDQKDRSYRSLEEELDMVTSKLHHLQRTVGGTEGGSADHGEAGLQDKVEQLEKTVSSQNKKLKQQEKWLTEKDKTNYKLQQIRERLDETLKKSAKEIKRLKDEMRTLKDQVQENKDLNKTLKLELSVYETLENTENQGLSNGKHGSFDMREFLTEIRHLRTQLERCIETNNELRKKLEEHLRNKSQRQRISATNMYYTKKPGSVTSQDVPDGLPSVEQMSGGFRDHHESFEILRVAAEEDSRKSLSPDSCISDCASGSSSNLGKSGFGVATWPLMADSSKKAIESKSSPGGTFHREDFTVRSSRLHHSDGNLSYHVDDSPCILAEMTSQQVDSDLRTLFAFGKLDDFEKLKKENGECAIVLKGIEARIQDRLKIFRNMSPRENMEYSTLKELSLSVENLRICLNEETSLLGCFWTSSLPKEGVESKLLFENESMKNELSAIKSKYTFLTQFVQSAEERLHATNQQKQNMEDFIYKQLKKTTKVMVHARGNFEKKLLHNGSDNKQEGTTRAQGHQEDFPVYTDN
ncbi:golgin subfamily A member 4-like isoform X5 [Ostrea edulis]|uniref:golgin subfamily A member 4-like isoform X5 n=2 Tax=Ostrea edulis TaxID=37623 RepID=UPI0024AED58F|nr:golgin subfamily A member 4-like isoform X5 [Ostrea edulis]